MKHCLTILVQSLTLEVQPFQMPQSGPIHTIDTESLTDTREDISNLVFSTVPTDVQAPLGADTSAGAVMTEFRFCIYTGLAFKIKSQKTS